MRILKDADGDLWGEASPGLFTMHSVDRENAASGFSLEYIKRNHGPIEVFDFEPKSRADTSLYRITYFSGRERLGNRHRLGCILGAQSYANHRVVKIERTPQPDWTDVTTEFIKDTV